MDYKKDKFHRIGQKSEVPLSHTTERSAANKTSLTITYESAIERISSGIKNAKKDLTGKLAVKQNKCLRVVAEAYKATPSSYYTRKP